MISGGFKCFGAALFIGKVISWCIDLIAYFLWGYEKLTRADEMFTHNNNLTPVVDGSILTTTKFEFEPMRDFLKKTIRSHGRMKSTVCMFMGKWYFQQMTDKQLEERLDKIIIKLDKVKSKE